MRSDSTTCTVTSWSGRRIRWNASYSGAPSDDSAWATGECGMRVLRGGSWAREPRYQRLTTRNKYQTGTRSFSIGFRVARESLKVSGV